MKAVGIDPDRLMRVSYNGEELQIKVVISVPFLNMAVGKCPRIKLFAAKDKKMGKSKGT